MSESLFQKQNLQYQYPYHHIPYFAENGTPFCYRSFRWGYEYLGYVSRVQKLVTSLCPDSLLEVGCGDGKVIGFFENKIQNLKGIDLSVRAIKYAKAFAPSVDFQVQDLSNINEKYKVVLLIEVLEHIRDSELTDFVPNLFDCMTKGSHLIISVPTTVRKTHPKHHRHYTEKLLLSHLKMGG